MADGAIVGARVYTQARERPVVDAIAWKGGQVIAAGSDEEIRQFCDARSDVILGAGLTVTPGLVEGHFHPFHLEETRGADLTACESLIDLRQSLEAERRATREGEWVLGWGLSYDAFDGHPLGYRQIQDVVGDSPLLIAMMDGHTAVANSVALTLAGIDPADPQPSSRPGVVVEDGFVTGELREPDAFLPVRERIPLMTAGEYRGRLHGLLVRLASLGVTSAHGMLCDVGRGVAASYDVLDELEEEAELPVQLVIPVWQAPDMDSEQTQGNLSLFGRRGRSWRGGVVKFFADGVIDSGTAWLCEPDVFGEGVEPFWPEPKRYEELVRTFAEAGFLCATHAVGDRAVKAALDAYERSRRPLVGQHRIEHIELLSEEDLPRFSTLHVAASMQPLHMQWRKQGGADSWASRLHPGQVGRAFRCGDLLRSGANLVLGSDWPVANLDPRVGMAWARLRRAPGRAEAGSFEPRQCLSGHDALSAYTTAAAQVLGEAAQAGRLAPGFRADMTVFGDDPVRVPPDELVDLPVVRTVSRGRTTFRAAD